MDRPRTRGEDLADFGIPSTLKCPVSAPPPLFGGVPELLPPLPVRCQAFDYAGITLWAMRYAEIGAAPERCAHWLCRNDYAKSKTCSGSNQKLQHIPCFSSRVSGRASRIRLEPTTLQLQLIDHVIIGIPGAGGSSYFSFKEAGVLS
jgi:hypothetical protein